MNGEAVLKDKGMSEDKEKKIIIPNTFELMTCISMKNMKHDLERVMREIKLINLQIDTLLAKLEDK